MISANLDDIGILNINDIEYCCIINRIKFAPPYACIFMDHTETEFLKMQDIKPWFWKIFIDVFFIWTENEESLEKFLEEINKFHPNLTFTYEKSKEKINLLDLVIKIKEGRIITDLYCKPTDDHQYLHYDSRHTDHTKKLIIFSQILHDLNVHGEDLNVQVEDLKTWFRKRGYPDYLIKEQVEKALRLTPSDENNNKKVNGVPLVVTYNPAFKNLFRVIRKTFGYYMQTKRLRKCFHLPHLFPSEVQEN